MSAREICAKIQPIHIRVGTFNQHLRPQRKFRQQSQEHHVVYLVPFVALIWVRRVSTTIPALKCNVGETLFYNKFATHIVVTEKNVSTEHRMVNQRMTEGRRKDNNVAVEVKPIKTLKKLKAGVPKRNRLAEN